jgi:uncharacterized protein (TIGR02722 family)
VKKQVFGMMLTAGLMVLSTGCVTRVQYGDPTSPEPLSTDFGSSDLQQIAAGMVDSLLADEEVRGILAAGKPVMLVDKVRNRTMQHIDTESLTDSIRTKLIQSHKVRFLDRTTDQAVMDEFNAQIESGLVDPAKAVPKGLQYGAEYILISSMSEITQRVGRKTDTYYKFTMSLKSMRSGLLVWAEEKELRKVAERRWFGR